MIGLLPWISKSISDTADRFDETRIGSELFSDGADVDIDGSFQDDGVSAQC